MDKLVLILALLFTSVLRAEIVFNNPSAGGDGEYISCGTDAELDNFWQGAGVTICARVNITGTEPTNIQPRLWGSRDGTGGIDFLVDMATSQDVPKLTWDLTTTDATVYAGTANTDYWTTSGGWRTICVALDSAGSVLGAGSTVWSDAAGNLTDTTAVTGSGTLQSDAGNARNIGTSSILTNFFTGQMAWMVVWDDHLAQEEITRISTRRVGLKQVMTVRSNNVVMAFEFDDGADGQTEVDQAVIQDIGPYRHHCTLIGGTYARRTLNH